MRLGTSGFVGRRLRQARKARGIPATELAEEAGITTSQLYAYERDENSPSEAVLAQLAARLRLQAHYFLRPMRDHFTRDSLFFRAKAATSKADRDRAEARMAWLAELVDYAGQYVDFPDVSLPRLEAPTDPRELTMDDVDAMATAVRAHWALGQTPIPNMIRVMEAKGIVIGREEFLSRDLDAISGWSSISSRPFSILGSHVTSGVRLRFNAAHELGELITHRNVRLAGLREKDERAARRLMDRQAHRFAGSLLLPEEAFLADLPFFTLDRLAALKAKWKVSIAAMIQRLRALDLLEDSDYRSMQISLSRRGWRLIEPLDDTIPVEEPVLLRQAFTVMLEQGPLGPSEIRYETGMDDGTLARMTNLPIDRLREPAHATSIITLKAQP